MTIIRRNPQNNPMGNWLGIIVGLVILVALFMIIKGIVKLLYFFGPILLIATLIINYRIVLDYIKQLGMLFKQNPLWGIGATVLSVVLYPFVFAILLFRALGGKTKERIFGNGNRNDKEEFADYEILDEDLDLDDFGKVKEKEKQDRYDDYFRGE